MKGLRDDHRAVLVVLAGSETEERADSHGVQVRDCFQHIVAIFDRVDALQFLIERLGFRGVDGFLIHPARVKIADLLHFRRQLRIRPLPFAAFSATSCSASLFFSISSLKLPQRDYSGGIGLFFSQAPLA